MRGDAHIGGRTIRASSATACVHASPQYTPLQEALVLAASAVVTICDSMFLSLDQRMSLLLYADRERRRRRHITRATVTLSAVHSSRAIARRPIG
jgi:hypothetical protein